MTLEAACIYATTSHAHDSTATMRLLARPTSAPGPSQVKDTSGPQGRAEACQPDRRSPARPLPAHRLIR